MPRSVFLGRVVRPGEPEWTDNDRAWAVALLDVEAGECPGCGHPLSETTDPKAEEEGWYQAEAERCHACHAAAMWGRVHERDNEDTTAMNVRVIRRE